MLLIVDYECSCTLVGLPLVLIIFCGTRKSIRGYVIFPLLRAKIKVLDLSTLFGSQPITDELQNLISVNESVDWKKVSSANIRSPTGWRRLSAHSYRRLESARTFVKYDPQSRRRFVTQTCSDCQARLSIQPSTLRKKSAESAPSSDKVFIVSVTGATSNTLVSISARSSWVVTDCDEDQFEDAPQVICLLEAEFSLPLLLTHNPTSLVVDVSSLVEVEKPDVDEPSVKRARSCCITHPIVSTSQSISTTGCEQIMRDFVKRVVMTFSFRE